MFFKIFFVFFVIIVWKYRSKDLIICLRMIISDFICLLQLLKSCINDIIIFLENMKRLYFQSDYYFTYDKLSLKFFI